jgi:CDP-diglyceride synthetase
LNIELLFGLDGLIIAIVLFLMLIIATAVGYLVGSRQASDTNDVNRSQFSTIQGAVLGLLALLLGFTFAMTLSRFDTRKNLVLEEANAIGTTYLRAQLLPEPYNTEVSALLHQYVDVRLEFYNAGIDEKRLRAANEQTDLLHRQLWSRVKKAAKVDSHSITTGLFIQSLNEVIDLHEKRITAMRNHVPDSVILLLFIVAILTLGLTGYGSGLTGKRHFFVTTTVAILIVAVIYLIIDLDRPRRGLIKVSQQSMIDLRESIQKGYPY